MTSNDLCKSYCLFSSLLIIFLMSSFLEIDFVIKIHVKRSRRFDLSESIFKCE